MERLRNIAQTLFGAERASYRGLLVLAIATALLIAGQLDGWQWVAAAGAFLGKEAVQSLRRAPDSLPPHRAAPAGELR